MTVKEIAAAVGVTERSVHNWVKTTSEKFAEVSAKIAQAKSTSKAADYTLAEVCQIIEEGMGPAAADVYRTNAVNAEMQKQATAPAQLSAAYLSQINKLHDKGLIEKAEVRAMLGLSTETKELPQNQKALPAPERLSKQAYAVEMKQREKEQTKLEAEKKNYKLFDK